MVSELCGKGRRMFYGNIDVENVSLENVSSNDRLVDGNCNLFPPSHFCYVFPLVLDSQDYADALPAAVNYRVFRFDDSLEDFDANYCRVVSAEDESFEDLHLTRTDKQLHLGLDAGTSLSLNPS